MTTIPKEGRRHQENIGDPGGAGGNIEMIGAAANAFLIKPKTITAKIQLQSIKEELKSRCGAVWQKDRFDSTDELSYPYAIPSDKETEFSSLIEEVGIEGKDISRSRYLLPPQKKKHLKTAETIDFKAQSCREKATQLENEKLKEKEEIESKFAEGTILPEAYESALESLDRRYDERIENLKKEANKIEGAGLKIAIDGEKNKSLENAISPFTIKELTQGLQDEDVGDAVVFRKIADGNFLYDSDEKSFFTWDGHLWTKDVELKRRQTLVMVAEFYEKGADLSDDEKLSTAFHKRGKSLKTVRRQNAVLEMLQTGAYGKDGLVFRGDWDNHPGFVPCANGLLQIESGNLIHPEKNQFIRKASRIKFDPAASSEEFHSFVVEIMNGSHERANFLRRFFGYASLGNPLEDRFLFLFGKHGRNGKGTLVRCISSALGELARTFSPELLLLQKNPPSSSTPRPDLIHMKGTRIAIFSEINKGRKIDGATLKNLTGRDIVSARALFSNDVKNYSPTHTVVLQANHKPKAPADDQALWYRSILVPFDLSFVDDPKTPHERKIDRHREEKLLKNSSGILRWLVEGAKDYLKNGLAIPSDILNESEKYRLENDGIGSFIREKCVVDKSLSEKRGAITEAIKSYCAAGEFEQPTRNEINDYLRDHGFQEYHGKTGDRWIGLSIKKDSSDSTD